MNDEGKCIENMSWVESYKMLWDKNTNDIYLLLPMMIYIVDKKIKLVTFNTQAVKIIINIIIIHCSITLWNYKGFYPYKQKNWTCLVYDNICFDNEECDVKLKLEYDCDKIENENTQRNDLTRNRLSLTYKWNNLTFYTWCISYMYPTITKPS